MGHSKITAALLLVALLSGCTTVRWAVQKSMRREGLVNEAFPEVVWEEYSCGELDLPFFKIETNELIPPRVRPGGEFNHRIVYALCPAHPTEVLTGRLETRILYKGKPIFSETKEGHEFLPGHWNVDTFVEIPDDTAPGIYAYDFAFRSPTVSFDESLTFLVPAP